MYEMLLDMESQKWAIIKRLSKMGSEIWKTELLETESIIVEEEFFKLERKCRSPTKEWKLD